jgi:hypothetical protein
MIELSLTLFSNAMRLSSSPTSEEMLTENLTAFAGLPICAGACNLRIPFCRAAIAPPFYSLKKKRCNPPRDYCRAESRRALSRARSSGESSAISCSGVSNITLIFPHNRSNQQVNSTTAGIDRVFARCTWSSDIRSLYDAAPGNARAERSQGKPQKACPPGPSWTLFGRAGGMLYPVKRISSLGFIALAIAGCGEDTSGGIGLATPGLR